ncbi:MAG: VWA domain-containing protein [Candidatus Binatia bacterium]
MKFLTHVLLIIGLFATTVTRAQEPKPASKTSSEQDVEVLKIDTNLVTVPVIARSRNGSYIADLQQEEFKLTEDGVAQEIAFLASVDAPFYVVLMLDTSNSTKEKLLLIQRAAIAFLEQIGPNDKVKVISFDSELYNWNNFTSDKTILRSVISKTLTGGGTRVYDAVQLALDSLRPIQQRKAIVLFSDGGDYHSKKSSFDSTVWDLDESGVIVYPIRFDTRAETERRQQAATNEGRQPRPRTSNPGTRGNRQAPNANVSDDISWELDVLYGTADSYLKKLADRSGGQLYRADTLASLPKAFAAIAAELRTQYLLGYYPTNKSDNAAYRKIQVKTSRKDTAIRARPGYRLKNARRPNLK